MAVRKATAEDTAPEPVEQPLSSQALVDITKKLILELGLIDDRVLAKINMILEREKVPTAAADAVRAEAERLIGAQARLQLINAVTGGLIELASTGKSVVSHNDADLV